MRATGRPTRAHSANTLAIRTCKREQTRQWRAVMTMELTNKLLRILDRTRNDGQFRHASSHSFAFGVSCASTSDGRPAPRLQSRLELSASCRESETSHSRHRERIVSANATLPIRVVLTTDNRRIRKHPWAEDSECLASMTLPRQNNSAPNRILNCWQCFPKKLIAFAKAHTVGTGLPNRKAHVRLRP